MLKSRLPEICLAACLLGMAPLMVLQVFQLWERPHFQFFPIAWLGFIWFAWNGAGAITAPASLWRKRWALVVWFVGVVTCVMAVLLFSPWIANLAVLLCLFGWGLLRLGNLPWTRWVAWQALLVCALPLPGNMDAELVGRLQWISSRSASSLLDLFGVLHLQQGNVLEIRSRKLFVDEACSGVDSLYALAAISVLIVLIRQKPFIVSLVALLTVPLWAWFGNVLRLLTITLLLEFGHVDFSTGWKHTALGFVIFGLMALFFLQALEGLTQLFRRFSTASLPEANRQWHLIYNRIACYPEAAPVLVTEQDRYFVMGARSAEQPISDSVKPLLSTPHWLVSPRPWGSLCIAVALGCMTMSSILILRNTDLENSLVLPSFKAEQVDAAIPAEALPKTILGASQAAFIPEHRPIENFYGEYSRAWLYQDAKGSNAFTLSIDFPFRDFHPLWVCHTNIGSKVVSRSSRELSVTSVLGTHQAIVYQVDLVDDAGGASYLLFVNFDKNGEAVEEDLETGIKAAIMNRLLRPNPVAFKLPPVAYQAQLHVTSGAALSAPQKQEYESIFLEALPHMMAAVQKLNATADK